MKRNDSKEINIVKVGIILLGIWLFLFGGYLETFGATRIYASENPSLHCCFEQQDIVYILKNIVREGVKTVDEKNSIIEITGRFEHLKRFSKSEDQKIIFLYLLQFGESQLFLS